MAYVYAAYTVDLVILTLRQGNLEVLLIERDRDPYKGMWALPGGHVDLHKDPALSERAEDAAQRELEEETGLGAEWCRLKRYQTVDTPGRDPRGNYITTVYAAFMSPEAYTRIRPGDDAADVHWYPLDALPELAFDHKVILEETISRVYADLLRTDISLDLLPSQFSVSDMRRIHEMVRGEPLDPANFNRQFQRMVRDGLLKVARQAKPRLYERAYSSPATRMTQASDGTHQGKTG